jgi:YbgC/YbaW family acyl-CoA thioester hydrolase
MRDFTYRRRVQFAETDAAGIVHFAVFYRYMEEAEHAMWRDAGLSIERPGAGIGWPRVSASFEFHRPLRFEDEIDVRIAVAAVKSRTIEYSCTIARDGETIATGAMTIVCVRRAPGQPLQSVEIPADIVRRLRPDGPAG